MPYPAVSFRWLATALIAVGCFAGLLGVARWSLREDSLNVILITLDTTRADRLKTYGDDAELTDGFDRYAQSGVVFEQAYTTAPITLPAHASMLTGLYPPEHALRLNGLGCLSDKIAVLPEILKSRGYDTAAFVSVPVLDAAFGLNRGFDQYDDYATNSKIKRLTRQRRPGSDVVDSALRWLGQRKSKPFFSWIHLFDAHAPYDTREDLFGTLFESNPYDAGIATELREVERITTFLKQQHLDQNTLVIVTADHGEGLGEHREAEHGMLAYNSTLRVPLVFVGTKYCQPGRRVSRAVSLVDLVPTVLDLLKIRTPARFSGRSLKEALAGRDIPAHHYYAEAETPYSLNHWCPLHLILSDRWKFIRTTRPELYDLESDPGELRNLFDDSPQQAKELENILELTQQSFQTAQLQEVRLTDKDLSNLRSLGYAGVRQQIVDTESLDRAKLKDIKDMLPAIEKFDEAKRLTFARQFDAAIALLMDIEQMVGPGEYLEAGYLLGDCLTVVNRPDEAVEVFLRLLEKHPGITHTHFRLAMALSKQGQLERAADEFRTSLKHEPDSAIAHGELARVLVRSGKLVEAAAEFQEAIRLAPGTAAIHVEFGQLLLKLKRVNEAVRSFENALQINPREGTVQAALLNIYVQSGQHTKALELASKSVQSDPQSFEARFNLGTLLVSLNRLKEGLAELQRARRLQPDDPRVSDRIQQVESVLKGAGS